MSEFTTLRINRSQPDAASSGDWLRIEQPEWREPSTADFIAWLKAEGKGQSAETLFLYWAQFRSMCEDDGSLTVELQVHKSRPDLPYNASASHGELSDRYIHQASHKKSVTVETADSLDLLAQVIGSVSAVWESAVFAADGAEINPPPAITVTGSVLSFGREVSGVLRLSYTEEHDAYTLTITPRAVGDYETEDIDGAYESTFFAVWAGGVKNHEVDLPDMDGYCGGGSGSVAINPDDPNEEQCVRHNILIDPCTKEIIREWDEAIPCPDAGEDE